MPVAGSRVSSEHLMDETANGGTEGQDVFIQHWSLELDRPLAPWLGRKEYNRTSSFDENIYLQAMNGMENEQE